MSKKQIIILSAAVAVLVLGGIAYGGYNFWQAKNQKAACTMEAKLCPDGSAVGRSGPNCEFAACPQTSNETANLQIYRNDKLGFEFKYPKDKLKIELNVEQSSSNKYKQYLDLSFFPVAAGRNSEAALNLGTLMVGNYSMLGVDNKSISSLDEYIQYYMRAFPDKPRATHGNNGLNWFCDLKPSKTINESANMKTCITEANKNYYKIDFFFNKDSKDYFTENEFDQLVNTFKFTDNQNSTADWQTYRNEEEGFEIKYPKDWYYLSCMDGAQFFLYDSADNVENCEEPRGEMSDFSIIGPSDSPPGNINYAKGQKNIKINGLSAKYYINVPVGQDLQSPGRLVDKVIVTNNNKTYTIGLESKNRDIKILEKILSTFKFTK